VKKIEPEVYQKRVVVNSLQNKIDNKMNNSTTTNRQKLQLPRTRGLETGAKIRVAGNAKLTARAGYCQ